METTLSNLKQLEAESIHIIREVATEFNNPVMLYSVGKDSSVMLRLAQKAFAPGDIPFPLMHIDTGYKFKEMIEFRDKFCAKINVKLIVERNERAIKRNMNPWDFGTDACCQALKTNGLLSALKKHGFDAAFGGGRREEEKSRAKERVYSFRNSEGAWNPKNQRPELWNIYNAKIKTGESIRAFPLSNWTELDIWQYIAMEKIPIVPIYYAKKRSVIRRGNLLIPVDETTRLTGKEQVEEVTCRFRSLGCSPCTGAIESKATTIEQIIHEMMVVRKSERESRIIDHSSDSAMEEKKRKGYF